LRIVVCVQGKAEADPTVPPPPPTIAPKAAVERRPRVKQAYRRQKKSSGERQQEQQQARAAEAAARAGREVFLDAQVLAAKAAAIQGSQQWFRDVMAPVTNIVPNLVQRLPLAASPSTSSGRGAPTLLVVDGFNLLHQHPSTKQDILQDNLHLAQQHMHKLLKAYAAQENVYVLVVYDAHSVSRSFGSSPSSRRQQHVQSIDDRVSTVHEAGMEADTIIIDLVQQLVQREAAAGAAGHLGVTSPLQLILRVFTNDTRIQEAVASAVFEADNPQHGHIVSIHCSSSTGLSEELRLVENKLQGAKLQQQQQQRAAAGSFGMPLRQQPPNPQHDTVAWAQHILAQAGHSSGSGSSSDDSCGEAISKRRRRRRTQQQQQEDAEAQQLAVGLSDEELLQMSAGVYVAGATAVSAAAAGAESSQAMTTATAPTEEVADATQRCTAIAPPLPSTSQQLDDILEMDISSCLLDIDSL